MILLDFDKPDLRVYRDDPNLIPLDPAVISETAFLLPIKLVINNIDLLELDKSSKEITGSHEGNLDKLTEENNVGSWLLIPLIGFAVDGLETARKVCEGKSIDFYLPDIGAYLHFETNGNQTTIFSSLNGRSVTVSCKELLESFDKFVFRIRSVLKKEIPQISELPYWKGWLEGS